MSRGCMKQVLLALLSILSVGYVAAKPMNVILIMADDISAREFPMYESTKWYGDRRAKTPVLDKIAAEGGSFIETVWASTICKPTRVQIMNGTYAHQNKYWDNSHMGTNSHTQYVAYQSAPITLGNMSRDAGYANIWVSKTHNTDGADLLSMGFNEGVFNPAETKRAGWNPFGTPNENPYEIFRTADPKHWDHKSFYWWPEIQLINHPDYPAEPYKYVKTTLNDYAPDLEMEYIFDFMDRSKASGKPFFVYHTPHLGHTARDPAVKGNPTQWVPTPEISYNEDEGKFGTYTRADAKYIPQKDGTYKTKNITPEGISYHLEYLDYQLWQYLQKLQDMGELENTVIIFTADNATQGWGKASINRQKGPHVPMMIYAPGVEGLVQGRQNIQADLTDVLPTLADIMGFEFPEGYDKLDGKSMWPYLTQKTDKHRDYIYAMRLDAQMIRNDKVLKDGHGVWYDATKTPADYDSFVKINDLPEGEHKAMLLAEKAKLEPMLAQYDLYNTDSEAPLPPADSDGDGLSDAFEKQYAVSNATDDPDGDGIDNFHEFVFGTNPTDPNSPTAQQKPHLIEVSDAQGEYVGLAFQRNDVLGYDYFFIIEGTIDGKKWQTDGVVQQYSTRSNGDGTSRVIARVAADKSKALIKDLRLKIIKPKKRQPRKYKNLLQ